MNERDADEPGGEDGRFFNTQLNSAFRKWLEAQQAPFERIAEQAREAQRAPFVRIAEQAREAQRAPFVRIAEQAREAQRAPFERVAQQVAAAQRQRLEAITQSARWSVAGTAQLGTLGAGDVGRFAELALGPITRAARGLSADAAGDIAGRIGRLNAEAFDAHTSVADLREVLDRDDAVEQLVGSDELRQIVESVVESESVGELVAAVDQEALEASEPEVVDNATGLVAAVDGLTLGQAATILTAIDLLVIAAVLKVYGYDVGAISSILAIALSPVTVYGFVALMMKKDGS